MAGNRLWSAGAGDEVFAGSDAELVEDAPEVELDGLDADVQLGCRLPIGAAGGDQAGHRLLGRLLGRGQTGQGGCRFRSHGRASSGQLPVADLQVRPGARVIRRCRAARSRRASEISSWPNASGTRKPWARRQAVSNAAAAAAWCPAAVASSPRSRAAATMTDAGPGRGQHRLQAGRDGSDDNRSWHCGVEGSIGDPEILALRAGQSRALLGTLLLSRGVPMILGGDELGRRRCSGAPRCPG